MKFDNYRELTELFEGISHFVTNIYKLLKIINFMKLCKNLRKGGKNADRTKELNIKEIVLWLIYNFQLIGWEPYKQLKIFRLALL
ncbi:MAG: hypothetical protein ACKO2V_13670, partial [Snowella sp.]